MEKVEKQFTFSFVRGIIIIALIMFTLKLYYEEGARAYKESLSATLFRRGV